AGEDLFPVTQGATWTYSGTAVSGTNNQKLNMIASITSSTSSGGKTTVLVHWTQNGQPIQDETYLVSAQEVVRLKAGANGAIASDPPVPVIKYPMTVGKTWAWAGNQVIGTAKIPGKATLKVAARETIKTQAGTFSAYRVDMNLSSSQRSEERRVGKA